MRALVVGGAPFSLSLKRRALGCFGDAVFEFYGATELGVVAASRLIELQDSLEAVGLAAPGAQIRVLGADGKSVPKGEVGTIFVRTPTMASGYNRSSGVLDDARPSVTTNGDPGWRTVGDLGRIDRYNQLQVVGRDVELIISGGVNVYAREVEQALEAHPSVVAAAVTGYDDNEWGESVRAHIQCVVPVDIGELIETTAAQIGRFKLPKEIFVVKELPRNGAGKLQKHLLSERVGDRVYVKKGAH